MATVPDNPPSTFAPHGVADLLRRWIAPRPLAYERSCRSVLINGKFLSAPSTGVHRVAAELIRHCNHLLRTDPAWKGKLRLDLVIPYDAEDRAKKLGVPYRVVGPFRGIPWEQLTLPSVGGGSTILSLCNVGPVTSRDAVTMFHDAQVRLTPKSYSLPFRLWYRFHQFFTGRRHQRILTISQYSRQQLSRFGLASRSRVTVIPNGVDHFATAQADDRIIAKLGLDSGHYVAALANTQSHKNIRVLIDCFARPDMADKKLVLFGAATAADFEAIGAAPGPNVIFAGKISDEELRAIYENALCFACPSTTEGFGLPPLEAMGARCPAVVAPCGALPEVCGEAALYADAHAPEEWAEAICELERNPALRRKLVTKGDEQVARFTWDGAARSLLATMNEYAR